MGKKQTQQISLDFLFQRGAYQNRYVVNLQESQDRLFIDLAQTAFYSGGNWHLQTCNKNVEEASIQDDKSGQAWYVNPLMKQFNVFHFHDVGDTSPMKSFSSLHDNLSLKKNGSNIAAFLNYLQEKFPKHFRRIEKTIESVSPFFDSFNLTPNRLNPEIIRLEWKLKRCRGSIFQCL